MRGFIRQADFVLYNHKQFGHYSGWTSGLRIDFYITTYIPYQNLYHEFGHLLNNLANDKFSSDVENHVYRDENNKFLFGGNYVGIVDPKLVFNNSSVWDPTFGSAIAALQHNDGSSGEQWADIFANYVSGNISLIKPGGRTMMSFIQKELDSYITR